MWNFHNLPFGTLNYSACCGARMTPWSQFIPLECQMRKRKPATASKHARSPKIAQMKPQRAAQAIVRSPKVRRSVAASSAELPPKPHNESKPAAPLAIDNRVTALQEDISQTMTDNSLSKGFDFIVSHRKRARLSSKAAGNGAS